MKYGELNLGQIEAVVNKLGGMDGVKRFLSGELIVKAIKKTLTVWKTIKLDTGFKTADDFRIALKQDGYKIGNWANDILEKPAFTATTEKTDVDLVVVSVAELGFKDGAIRKDIYKQAEELGLELCPAEVGPQLRLQYKDQPEGEWLLIGMEPIAISGGGLGVFYVARGSGARWLEGGIGDPRHLWDGSFRWVFVRPLVL